MSCRRIAPFAATIVLAAPLAAQPCAQWGQPATVGHLERRWLPEASGVAVSRDYPDRLYHHNDSGDGPYFYVTRRDGSKTQRVLMEGFRAGGQDVEAMSLGPCPDGGTCLFFGAIGDNSRRRHRIEIVVVREPEQISAVETPVRRLAARYPDQPHNAEGMAVHPNGDIYVFTKGPARVLADPGPAGLYRLAAAEWQSGEEHLLTFTHVGELDLPVIATREESGPLRQIVTGFDIAPDGGRFVVITYGLAYEFAFDLSAGPLPPAELMVRGKDYSVIPLEILAQQEAVSYLPDGRGIVYTTEARWEDSPVVEVACAAPAGR